MWLISDYDGTLRNGKDGGVDPRDLQFVKDFISQEDNHFVVASGRSYIQLIDYMTELDLHPDYYISNAGTYIVSGDQEVIYSSHLANKTLPKILDYLKTINVESVIYADRHGEYYLFTHNDSVKAEPNRPILNHDYDTLYGHEIACFKLLDKAEVLDDILQYLQKHFADEISLIINTDSNLVEIHPKSSSKGHAIKVLQKKLNLADDEIITVGDDDNDVTMLDYYQNSFCVRQVYNERIQNHGSYLIDSLFEIGNYLKK